MIPVQEMAFLGNAVETVGTVVATAITAMTAAVAAAGAAVAALPTAVIVGGVVIITVVIVGVGVYVWSGTKEEATGANSKLKQDVEGQVSAASGAPSPDNNDDKKSDRNDKDKVKPESAVKGSKKHGVKWKEGPARAKATGTPQGQWSESDLDYATEKANTLKPGENGYFDLPEGSKSVVHMPDGTTQPATRMWIRNNGTGTWHGYPMP